MTHKRRLRSGLISAVSQGSANEQMGGAGRGWAIVVDLVAVHQVRGNGTLRIVVLSFVLVLAFIVHCDSFLHCGLLRVALLLEELGFQADSTLGILGALVHLARTAHAQMSFCEARLR